MPTTPFVQLLIEAEFHDLMNALNQALAANQSLLGFLTVLVTVTVVRRCHYRRFHSVLEFADSSKQLGDLHSLFLFCWSFASVLGNAAYVTCYRQQRRGR